MSLDRTRRPRDGLARAAGALAAGFLGPETPAVFRVARVRARITSGSGSGSALGAPRGRDQGPTRSWRCCAPSSRPARGSGGVPRRGPPRARRRLPAGEGGLRLSRQDRSGDRRGALLGVHVNADNLEEIERIAVTRARVATRGVIGLRINPLVGGGASPHQRGRARLEVSVSPSTRRPTSRAACSLAIHGSPGCTCTSGLRVQPRDAGGSRGADGAAGGAQPAPRRHANHHPGHRRRSPGRVSRYRAPALISDYVTALRAGCLPSS